MRTASTYPRRAELKPTTVLRLADYLAAGKQLLVCC